MDTVGEVYGMECCGICEYHGINRVNWSTKRMMYDLWDNYLDNSNGRMNYGMLIVTLRNGCSGANPARLNTLQSFIRRNRLGKQPEFRNPNTNNYIRTGLWNIDKVTLYDYLNDKFKDEEQESIW